MEYGQAEMSRILDHFVYFCPESNSRQSENQWLQVKLYVCKKVPLSDRNFYSLWPKMLQNHGTRFSLILKVVHICMLLPMSTAVCERGFSAMNRTKTKARSTLSNSHLSSLLYISTDGPLLDMFHAQPAVTHWSEVCHRRAGVRKTKKQDGENEDSSDGEFASDSDLDSDLSQPSELELEDDDDLMSD